MYTPRMQFFSFCSTLFLADAPCPLLFLRVPTFVFHQSFVDPHCSFAPLVVYLFNAINLVFVSTNDVELPNMDCDASCRGAGIWTATECSRRLGLVQPSLPACQFMHVPELYKEMHKLLVDYQAIQNAGPMLQ